MKTPEFLFKLLMLLHRCKSDGGGGFRRYRIVCCRQQMYGDRYAALMANIVMCTAWYLLCCW